MAGSQWQMIGVGVASGFLSGLFGVGGGILMVPGLVLWLGMAQRQAVGTSLGAMVLISAAGLGGFVLSDSVVWLAGLLIFLGAAIGVTAGTWLLNRLPVHLLRVGFAGLMLLVAVRFLISVPEADGHSAITVWLAFGYVTCGLLTGLLAGTMGIGGGIIMVPVMILLFGFTPATAKGTSLLVIFSTSIVGTVRNRRLGNIASHTALLVGVAGVASAFVGALGANQLSPRIAASLFAILLGVVAVQMLRQDKDKEIR